MSRTATLIGPNDNGRRMALAEFDRAEVVEGHHYELSRGVISVSDVPGKKHLRQVHAINRQLYLYQAARPEVIKLIAGGGDCKILAEGFESERHADIFVYKTDMPEADDLWAVWVPEIVVEVVSPGSERRDYEEKPPEYLAFGVAEYWIFDEPAKKVTVMQRSGGRWKVRDLGAGDAIQTRLLPGFELRIAGVFGAAEGVA
jgi:Uma2 family endonuclease